MGCDPYRKDILVEVDWMKPSSFAPAGTRPIDMWADVEKVFKDAPVMNPDGSQGIIIHIDRGQDSLKTDGVFTGGGTLLNFHYTMDFATTGHGDYANFDTHKNKSCELRSHQARYFSLLRFWILETGWRQRI